MGEYTRSSIGRLKEATAERTPGTVASRCTTSRKNCARRGPSGYLPGGGLTVMVREPCGLKPGFTVCRLRKLSTSRLAPISSTTESAICPATSRLRARWRRPPPVFPQPLSRRMPLRSGRETCSAGASPKPTPVSSEIPSVNANAGRSTRIGWNPGSVLPASVLTSQTTPHCAIRAPNTAAVTARRLLSSNN